MLEIYGTSIIAGSYHETLYLFAIRPVRWSDLCFHFGVVYWLRQS
jgi:hypothetical protein